MAAHFAAAAYTLGITVASVIPGPSETSPEVGLAMIFSPTVQNFLHLPAYFFLTLLVCRSLESARKDTLTNSVAALLGSMFLGGFSECLQSYVPGRFPSVADLVMNSLGTILAAGSYFLLRSRVPHVIPEHAA